jgi:hypothetical protein
VDIQGDEQVLKGVTVDQHTTMVIHDVLTMDRKSETYRTKKRMQSKLLLNRNLLMQGPPIELFGIIILAM